MSRELLIKKLIRNKKVNNKIFFLFLLLLSIYTCNFKFWASNGDTITFRYLPYSILNEFNFNLDEFYEQFLGSSAWLIYEGPQGEEIPYYLIKVKGHYLPSDGIGPAILSLPIFLIPVIFNLSPESWTVVFLSKFVASILIALSSVFIFLSVTSLANEKKAWLITFVYALCSGMWTITSQALYQQTGSEFFLAMSIYFLVKGLKEPRFIAYTGASLACTILMRPTNIMVMCVLTIYVLHRYRNKFWRYVLYAAPIILFIFGYNYFNHGSALLFSLMIYNPNGALFKTGSTSLWSTSFLTGVSGLFISPSRGLFIYSPVFIFSFIAMATAWRRKQEVLFKYFCAVVAGLIIIHSKWYDWWGGWTYGCRMLNDSIPFLSLLLLPAMDYLKGRKKIIPIFTLTIIFSFLVQVMGALMYNNEWNANPNIDGNQDRLWFWGESQLSYYFCKLLKRK